MHKIVSVAALLALALGLVTVAPGGLPGAHAALKGAPYLPEIDARFDVIEQTTNPIQESGNTGLFVSHHAKAIINLNASGAATSVGITIPAGAIIQQSYWFLKSSGAAPAGTTLAFQCVAANDLYSASNIAIFSANDIKAGVQTGTAATMLYVASACTVKYVLGLHDVTSGIVDLFIDYTVAN